MALGEAFVTAKADTSEFLKDLEKKLKAVLKGFEVRVKVVPDVDKFHTLLQAAVKKMPPILVRVAPTEMDKFHKLVQSEMKALGPVGISIVLDNPVEFHRSIAREMAALGPIKVGVEPTGIAKFKSEITKATEAARVKVHIEHTGIVAFRAGIATATKAAPVKVHILPDGLVLFRRAINDAMKTTPVRVNVLPAGLPAFRQGIRDGLENFRFRVNIIPANLPEFRRLIRDFFRANPAPVRIVLDLSQVGGPLAQLRRTAQSTENIFTQVIANLRRRFVNVLATLPAIAAKAFLGVAAAVAIVDAAIAKVGITSAISLQQAEVTLKALSAGRFQDNAIEELRKSAEAAGQTFDATAEKTARLATEQEALAFAAKESAQQIKDLRDVAIATPFDFKSLSDGVKNLQVLGLGFDAATAKILQLGDALALSGEVNGERLQQVMLPILQAASSGKLLGQDLNQLAQRLPGVFSRGKFEDIYRNFLLVREGIKLTDEEFQSLKETEGFSEVGSALDAIFETLKQAPGIEGALKRVTEETLPGAFQALKEDIALRLGDAFLPVVKNITKLLRDPAVNDALSGLIDGISSGIAKLVDDVIPFFLRIAPAIQNVLKQVNGFFAEFGRAVGPLIEPGIKLIGDAFLAVGRIVIGFVNFLRSDAGAGLRDYYEGLRNAIGGVIAFFVGFGPILSAIFVQIGRFKPALDAIGIVAAAIGRGIAAIFGNDVVQSILKSRATFIVLAAAIVLLTGPVSGLIAAVAGIAFAFKTAWENSLVFRQIVAGVLQSVGILIREGIQLILGLAKSLLQVSVAASQVGKTVINVANALIPLGDPIPNPFDEMQAGANAAIGAIDALNANIDKIPLQINTTIQVRVVTVEEFSSTADFGFNARAAERATGTSGDIDADVRSEAEKLRDFVDQTFENVFKGVGGGGGGGSGGGGGGGGAADAAGKAARQKAEDFKKSIADLIRDLNRNIAGQLKSADAGGIDSALTSLSFRIQDLFREAGKKVPSGLVQRLSFDNAILKQLARERDAVIKKIQDAEAKFSAVRDTALGFGSIAGAVQDATKAVKEATEDLKTELNIATIDIAGSFGIVTQEGVKAAEESEEAAEKVKLTTASLIKSFTDRAAALVNFRQRIEKLAKRGLDKDIIDQLISQGPEASAEAALAIDQGGKDAIKALNDQQAVIEEEARKLGGVAVDSAFRTGSNFIKGVLDGLRATRDETQQAINLVADNLVKALASSLNTGKAVQLGRNITKGIIQGIDDKKNEDINAAVDKLVDNIIERVKKKLKIKSPSRVMAQLFSHVPSGAALGIASGIGDVRSAGDALASSLLGISLPDLGSMGLADAQAQLGAMSIPVAWTRPEPISATQIAELRNSATAQRMHPKDLNALVGAMEAKVISREYHAPTTIHANGLSAQQAEQIAAARMRAIAGRVGGF